jgi:hypothetical protein
VPWSLELQAARPANPAPRSSPDRVSAMLRSLGLKASQEPAPPSASSCPEFSEASPAQNGHLAIRCSKDVVSSS